MGIKTIMQARKVLVVANGLAKAKAVKDGRLRPRHPRGARPPSCRCTPTASSWPMRRL